MAEHKGGIAVAGDELGIGRLGELPRAGKPAADVDGLARGIMAVEFPEMHVGGRDAARRAGPALQQPGHRADGAGQLAVNQHDLAVRKLAGADPGERVAHDALGAVEDAVDVDVAVVRARIADLGVVGVGTQRPADAVLEQAGPRAPHEVHVALDVAVAQVGLAVDLERVLVAVEIHVLQDRARGGRPVQDDGLRLRAALRGGVPDAQVFQHEVVDPVGQEDAAVIDVAPGAPHRDRARVGGAVGVGIDARARIVEFLVVGVGNDGPLPVLAHQGDRVLVGEEDHLGVGALPDRDRGRRGVAVGNEVERALHRAEVPGAVRRDGQLGGARRRRRRLGRETPGRRLGQAGVSPRAGLEGARVDRDVVGLAVGQRSVAGIDGRLAARDDHRIVPEVGLPADRLGRGRAGADVDLVHHRLGGGVMDLDLAARAQLGRRSEGEAQRRVRGNRAGGQRRGTAGPVHCQAELVGYRPDRGRRSGRGRAARQNGGGGQEGKRHDLLEVRDRVVHGRGRG